MTPRLFSYEQAAEYLGLSVREVERLTAIGELPKVRRGRRVLLDRLDLDRLVEIWKEPVNPTSPLTARQALALIGNTDAPDGPGASGRGSRR